MANDEKSLSPEDFAKEFWDGLGVVEYNEEAERLAEENALAEIESQSKDIPTASTDGLWGSSIRLACDEERKRLDFEKNLVLLARKRRVSLRRKNWRTATLELAAMEHPELRPGRRMRGRPPKSAEGGMSGDTPIDDAYAAVENIRNWATEKYGRTPSVAETCRSIVAFLDKRNGRPHDPESEGVYAQVRTLQNRHSRQKGLLEHKVSR